MKSTIKVSLIAISLVALLMTSTVGAISLENRTGLEFQLGIRGADDYKDEIAYDGIVTRYGTDNLMFSMGLKHWVDENMAMTFRLRCWREKTPARLASRVLSMRTLR